MEATSKVSSGVQALIDRIRNEGVQAGEQKASQTLDAAKKEAAELLAKAKAEAADVLAKAHAEIETERNSAKDAMQLALRDSMLSFRAELGRRFTAAVKGLVGMELNDKEFLQQVILAVAGQAKTDDPANRSLEILLSPELFPKDEKEREQLEHFLMGAAQEMFKQEIELKPAGDNNPGIRIRCVNQDIEIDLTEEAVSALILKHLLPRFRAMAEEATG